MFDLVLFSFHHKFLWNRIVLRSCINSIKFHNLCVTVSVWIPHFVLTRVIQNHNRGMKHRGPSRPNYPSNFASTVSEL